MISKITARIIALCFSSESEVFAGFLLYISHYPLGTGWDTPSPVALGHIGSKRVNKQKCEAKEEKCRVLRICITRNLEW